MCVLRSVSFSIRSLKAKNIYPPLKAMKDSKDRYKLQQVKGARWEGYKAPS